MNDTTRFWLFSVEDDNGEHYVDTEGKTRESDVFYIGSSAEAEKEARRRADLWEERTGMWVWKTTYESHGKVVS